MYGIQQFKTDFIAHSDVDFLSLADRNPINLRQTPPSINQDFKYN